MIGIILFYFGFGLILVSLSMRCIISNNKLIIFLILSIPIILLEPYLSFIPFLPQNHRLSALINSYEIACILLGNLLGQIYMERRKRKW